MLVDAEARLTEIVRGLQTVAVIGIKDASQPSAPAHRIPKQLQAMGVRIIPVNPELAEALGEPSRPNIGAVEERVDVVDVFRRSEAVGELADEILALPADRRPPVVWMQTGIRNDEAADRLVAAGIDVVMDRCLGSYARMYRN